MRKVIDAGALRSQFLETFLVTSASNFAVITDYAAMESLKGDARVNVVKNLEIVSRYPKQVIVLKSTRKIVQLKPRSSGLHARFIDEDQTRHFVSYCNAVVFGKAPADIVAADIESKASQAQQHFERLEASVDGIRTGIGQVAASYSLEDLNTLRKRHAISDAFSDRIRADILRVTAFFFQNGTNLTTNIPIENAVYSYPFRYALCSYLLILKWIADGGYSTVSSARMRNDFTDMTYAAYATFFDGLISEDKKLLEIYTLSRWVLKGLLT